MIILISWKMLISNSWNLISLSFPMIERENYSNNTWVVNVWIHLQLLKHWKYVIFSSGYVADIKKLRPKQIRIVEIQKNIKLQTIDTELQSNVEGQKILIKLWNVFRTSTISTLPMRTTFSKTFLEFTKRIRTQHRWWPPPPTINKNGTNDRSTDHRPTNHRPPSKLYIWAEVCLLILT